VREQFPAVEVIETGQNLGVPRGFNVGFRAALEAGADYVLMLNNDTTVAPDMLAEMVRTAEADRAVGIVMPKVLRYDHPDLVWSTGGRYRRFPPAIVMIGLRKPDAGAFDELRSIEYAPGCGLLIARQAFERAGLFDPGYFFLYDDWDFSERVRAHGLQIAFAPSARMWHKVSRTTRSQSDLFWRVWGESSVRYYRRHGRPVFLSLPIHLGYIVLRELPGIILVLGYFIALPPIMALTFLRKYFQRMGLIRFMLMANLMLFMAALPIKMVLRWVFNLKYLIAIPEYFLNF